MAPRMMYLDESGELGFNPSGSRHFVGALVCTSDANRLKNAVKRWSARLISNGWPKAQEIKATELYHSRPNRSIPANAPWKQNPNAVICELLQLIGSHSEEIRAVSVVKAKIVRPNLKKAPYGILYNYFTSWVIIPAALHHDDIHLIVDQRNKESHTLEHFDGYIETRIWSRPNPPTEFKIDHMFSHQSYGLRAVDFVAWAIFRYREHGDATFYSVLQPYLKQDIVWP
ncbi:MAG TPA: DUF3800 domain-containing protein [Elusimicrobiota bacterium]|jgi:hypothetical protein|nr:DUF3800 domain-containing protein [Elusimicrobiota bacterium]